MFDRPTRLFLRWRDRGDPRALGELFDRTAPELLRLGLHLAGNVADAEDLLQSTFLAAIESAPRFAKGHRVVPWLAGILTNRAHAERRRKQRAPENGVDGDDRAMLGDEPGAHAANRELGAAAKKALDELREPFRQPTVLRYVHGLEPAEIALLLNRSPGTVRAQIHRGIEQARRALPTGAIAFAAVAASAGRGLAAVRTAVLQRAGEVAAASGAVAVTTSVITTGVLMGKKGLGILATAIAVGLGSAAWWLGDERTIAPTNGASAEVVVAAPATAARGATDVTATSGAGDPTDSQRTPVVPAAAAPDAGWTMRTKVLDGPTKQPVGGALVELFGPRTMTLLELQRELADFARPGPLGIPYVGTDACDLPETLPLDVRLDGAAHPFLVPPARDTKPSAETRTASDGTFDVAMPASGGVLAITANDRATKFVALAKAPERDAPIEIWPTSRITGHVRTDRDEVPPTPIALLLRCRHGAWTVTTDANGAFAVDAPTDYAMVESRTPGWAVTRERILKNGQRWIDDVSARPNRENTIWIRRFGGAQLHVTDAATGSPIEQIALQSFDQHRMPRHCGRFFAPDGWLPLDIMGAEQRLLSPHASFTGPSQLTITVWADGYAPFTCERIDLYADRAEVVEAKLERGDVAKVAGVILRGGSPVSNARLQLLPRSNPGLEAWQDHVLARSRSSATGRFDLAAPPGDYVCTVFVGKVLEAQFPLRLGDVNEALTVELNDSIHLDVLVLDAEGRPCADHDVRAIGADISSRLTVTDASGLAALGPFAPGKITIDAPLVATHASWSPAATETIGAAAGSRPRVTLRLPSAKPFRIALAFRGEAPATGFAGFTAMRNGETIAVEPSGAVPLGFVRGWTTLQIDGPEGRRWDIQLPDDSRDGDIVTIGWRGPALRGVVTNERGKPFVGRVHAVPEDRSGTVSAATAPDGSFRLEGLASCAHTLRFSTEPNEKYQNPSDRLGMVTFRPATTPSHDPTVLRIALVGVTENRFDGIENTVVRGRVTEAAGIPAGGAWVSAKALIAQDGGDLELGLRASFQPCDADGRYCITVPRAMRHRFRVSRERAVTEQVVTLPGAAEVERDFVLR